MWDLNVDIISVDSTCDENETKAANDKPLEEVTVGPQTDDSGTSNSSVVNAADEVLNVAGDDDSSSTHNNVSAFDFDILNKGKNSFSKATEIEDEHKDNSATALVTMELFPVAGDGGVGQSEVFGSGSSSSMSRKQWLNLSVPDSGAVPELKAFQQQKVKKSRRGPRSRSSQYRGVTFYRRTGRWESHIW